MAHSVFPLLAPRTRGESIEGKPDEFRMLVDGDDTGVVLGGAALRVAVEFDGTRGYADIVSGLLEQGIPVPGEEFVSGLAEALAQVDLVRLLDEPLARPYLREVPSDLLSLHPLRHQCSGCGRSCQGHLLGPLDDAFLERAQSVHEGMVALFPELEQYEPFWEIEDNSVNAFRHALTTRDDGTCIYLGEDKLCGIHKHLGSELKPIVCRLFPLTFVQAEDGVRVGTPLRCYTHHQSWENGPEATPQELTGIPPSEMPTFTARGLDSSHRGRVVLNPEAEGDYAKALRAEEHLLGLLSRPDAGVEILLTMIFEMAEGEPLRRPLDGLVHKSGFGREIVRRLKNFSTCVREGVGALLLVENLGGHTEQIRDMLDYMDTLEPRPFTGLSEAERAWSMHSISEWIFLREWVHQPSFLAGILLLVLGVIVSRWRAEDQAPDHPEDEVSDPFGFTLACWCRLTRIGTNIVYIVDAEDDFHVLMRSLQGPG
jgi:Fe-S-cluster containining protein